MKQLQKGIALLFALMFLTPALALAQTDSTTSVSIQVQSLLGQITSLEQQLKTLIQTAAPSSTPSMWQGNSQQNNATSTRPMPPQNGNGQGGGQGNGMGNCSSFARNLSMGSQGSDVAQLQQMLSADGFLSASSTGIFGPLTAQALKDFQVSFGITSSSSATGFFGTLTRTFLQNHCGGQGQMGSSTPPLSGPRPGMGSTTLPTWQQGSSTPPMHPTPGQPMGSSTMPNPPCPQNMNQGAGLGLLFVSHVILPQRILDPCAATTSEQ